VRRLLRLILTRFIISTLSPDRLNRATARQAMTAAPLPVVPLPPLRRLPAWSVVFIEAPLSGPLSLCRVSDCVVMITLDRPLRLPLSPLQRFLRRVGRDEAVAAITDQVGSLGCDQDYADGEVVLQPTS